MGSGLRRAPPAARGRALPRPADTRRPGGRKRKCRERHPPAAGVAARRRAVAERWRRP